MTATLTLDMEFPERLAALRKEKGLTQKALAERVGVSVLQICRYETGVSQPSLEALKKLALGLSVTSDMLIFDRDERGPDADLKLQFERVSKFDAEDKRIARALLDGLILRCEAKRLAGATS